MVGLSLCPLRTAGDQAAFPEVLGSGPKPNPVGQACSQTGTELGYRLYSLRVENLTCSEGLGEAGVPVAALITQSQDKYPCCAPSLGQTRILICLSRVCCGLPGLLGMGGLTADEDFGKGGGLAVGVLDLHRVGGCVLNGTSEKEEGAVSPRLLGSTENSSPESRVGGEGGGYRRL